MFIHLIDRVVYDLLSLEKGSHVGEAVHFFIYDTIKIFLLLTVIIYLVAIVRTFLPPAKVRRILSHQRVYLGNIIAGLIGIITPFCTCSAIPLFLGFVEAGVPIGVTFTFLVASPMINEVALVMLMGLFGWKIALIYIASGLVIAIAAGLVIGTMNIGRLIERDMSSAGQGVMEREYKMSWKIRRSYAKDHTISILKKVWLYVVIGVGAGAFMHGYIPANFLAEYAGAGRWYAVPFAALLGIPLYSNAAGVIPLVSVLTEKGVAMGTALSFMMAVTALSLPEFMILRRVMKTRLILIFAGVVGAGIVFTGYLFNAIIG